MGPKRAAPSTVTPENIIILLDRCIAETQEGKDRSLCLFMNPKSGMPGVKLLRDELISVLSNVNGFGPQWKEDFLVSKLFQYYELAKRVHAARDLEAGKKLVTFHSLSIPEIAWTKVPDDIKTEHVNSITGSLFTLGESIAREPNTLFSEDYNREQREAVKTSAKEKAAEASVAEGEYMSGGGQGHSSLKRIRDDTAGFQSISEDDGDMYGGSDKVLTESKGSKAAPAKVPKVVRDTKPPSSGSSSSLDAQTDTLLGNVSSMMASQMAGQVASAAAAKEAAKVAAGIVLLKSLTNPNLNHVKGGLSKAGILQAVKDLTSDGIEDAPEDLQLVGKETLTAFIAQHFKEETFSFAKAMASLESLFKLV